MLLTDLRLFVIDVKIANRACMNIDGTDVRKVPRFLTGGRGFHHD